MSEVQVRNGLAKVIHALGPGDETWELVINRGSNDGVRLGQRFLVFGVGPELFDPDTRESLGRLEVVRGRGEVVHVQDHVATLRSLELRTERGGRRIIKNTGPVAMLSGTQVIEEEPMERAQPFRDPNIGDLARPV